VYILLAIAADRRVAVDITYVVLGSNSFRAWLMPTEARGNYLPKPHYLRETKTSQPATRVDTTCWQLFRPAINTAHFYLFFVAEVMSNYLTTDGLKKLFSTSGGPTDA